MGLDSYYVYTYIQEKAADTNELIFAPMVLLHLDTDCPLRVANSLLLPFGRLEKLVIGRVIIVLI